MVTVAYNGYTLPNIYDKFSCSENEKEFHFSCNFLILSSSSGGVVSAAQTAEEKLTEINKDFTLSFGGSAEFFFAHASNTGFLARPTLTKLTTPAATGTSRPYSFSVVISLPFPQSPYAYRREGNFSVQYGPNRQRTVNFACLYTAGGANSALANYTAGGKAWAGTVLTALGGTYELISENFSEEHEEKILNARIVYKEILANQSEGSINEAAIVDPRLDVSVQFEQAIGTAPTGGYVAVPTTTISISYSCMIDKEVVTQDTSLDAVYQNTVKPWIIKHAAALVGLNNYSQASENYIVQSERKSINPYSWTISGNLVVTAPKAMDSVIELSESITESIDEGISQEKLWDGKDDTYATWSLGRKRTASRMIVLTKLSSMPSSPPEYTTGDSGKWLKLSQSQRWEVKKLGTGTKVSGSTLKELLLYSVTFFEDYLYIDPASSEMVSISGGE